MQAEGPVEKLARALNATGEVVAAVEDDQWSNPTPCAEWNARALTNHLIFGQRLFAGILRGEQPPSRERLMELHAADQLGDDPAGAYREAAAELLAAFNQPGVLERVFQAPVGQVPGMVMLHLRMTEALVHGWDLARAAGQDARLPDDLAEEELAFASGPGSPRVPRTGHPFGPIQSVPGGAPAIDRLAAYLGRPVSPTDLR